MVSQNLPILVGLDFNITPTWHPEVRHLQVGAYATACLGWIFVPSSSDASWLRLGAMQPRPQLNPNGLGEIEPSLSSR